VFIEELLNSPSLHANEGSWDEETLRSLAANLLRLSQVFDDRFHPDLLDIELARQLVNRCRSRYRPQDASDLTDLSGKVGLSHNRVCRHLAITWQLLPVFFEQVPQEFDRQVILFCQFLDGHTSLLLDKFCYLLDYTS
jgi:hypothetical protein